MELALQTQVSELIGKVDSADDFVEQASFIRDSFPGVDVNSIVQDMGMGGFDLDNVLNFKDNMGSLSLPPINMEQFNNFNPLEDVKNVLLTEDGDIISRGIPTKLGIGEAAEIVTSSVKKVSSFIKPEIVQVNPHDLATEAFVIVDAVL